MFTAFPSLVCWGEAACSPSCLPTLVSCQVGSGPITDWLWERSARFPLELSEYCWPGKSVTYGHREGKQRRNLVGVWLWRDFEKRASRCNAQKCTYQIIYYVDKVTKRWFQSVLLCVLSGISLEWILNRFQYRYKLLLGYFLAHFLDRFQDKVGF